MLYVRKKITTSEFVRMKIKEKYFSKINKKLFNKN